MEDQLWEVLRWNRGGLILVQPGSQNAYRLPEGKLPVFVTPILKRSPRATAPKPHQKNGPRCGLPLILLCGHGICYHCVMSRKPVDPAGQLVDLGKFLCKVCNINNTIKLEAIKQDLVVAVDWCQLRLVNLEELGVEVEGDKLQWKKGTGRKKLTNSINKYFSLFRSM